VTDTRFISRLTTDDRVERWRDRYFWVNALTSLSAFASFLLYHGQALPGAWEPWIAVFQALCLLLLISETVGVYRFSRTLKEGWRQAPADTLALMTGVILGLGLFILSPWITGTLDLDTTFAAFAYLTQAGMLVFVVLRLMRLLRFVVRLVQSPLWVFAGSFATLSLVGTGLLMLPGAHSGAVDITPLDALFTATSAACVTGLIVVNTGEAWSTFGLFVIMTLIQIGGLGIMTFAAFFGMMFGRGMGMRDRQAISEMLNVQTIGRLSRLVMWMVGSVVIIEALGVWLMYGHWMDAAGNALPPMDQLFYSVFHSISAFCNAGFALYDDSMSAYIDNWTVSLGISWLVIMGGLGFVVIMECATYRWWALARFRKLALVKRFLKNPSLPRLSLQAKIVLLMTGLLIVVGMAGFLIMEWNHTLAGLSVGDKVSASLFQSASSRTAGFNSVDTGSQHISTQFWTIPLMLIGGSPGSVAGGIKTTTFAIMVLAVLATIRGRPTEAFRRRIPDTLIRKSLVMITLMVSLIATTTLALTLTEMGAIVDQHQGFERILFEATSACCTVGLTTGITSELTGLSQIIIILAMFVGRVGPLTLVLAISRRQSQRFEYPEESVMVG
jgi:trk system potassium uptake protein